ncbi:hypothetical protein NPIL_164191 [Nephila pilipes]|uniref:RNase H type-1 domain-containing protein n=1 Tax=Nephila pilipes TaxID=299642 RepID=A0A8X6N193_NEPPI|nr:hypothetical protein NPIL_164191 [Nephila pilipes]
MAVAYTDGSSDKSLNRGGAESFFAHPDGSIHKHRINTGMIASNFTSELLPIKEAFTIYIEGNECANSLAKEARNLVQSNATNTLADANAVARHRLQISRNHW